MGNGTYIIESVSQLDLRAARLDFVGLVLGGVTFGTYHIAVHAPAY